MVEVGTAEQVEALNMAGSPSVMVEGLDLFPDSADTPSWSCRLYPGGDGGGPTVAQLVDALSQARRPT